jgi:TrfA protein
MSQQTIPLTALDRQLASIEQAITERPSAQIIQLPLWPEPKRGTPNSFLRSALFSAIQGKTRKFLRETTIASQENYTVKFTGEQLNQEDLTVWETIVHLARSEPLGKSCSFTAHGLLKALGLATGGAQHRALHSSIIRLAACVVEIVLDGKRYFGHLIEGGVKDELTTHYVVHLNPAIIRLYGETQWTGIDWQQRSKLRRKPLAQALHAYFSTHRQPFPVSLSFLQNITGSRNAQPASFKRQCRQALDDLRGIGFLTDYTIDDDRVSVRRHRAAITSPQ